MPSHRRLLRFLFALAALAGCKATPNPEWHGLSGQIEVRRDEWGVPHIFAHDADDALYVLGYETARDRLFQLDLLRRRALGREAELFGASKAADDRIARVLGFGRLGLAGAEDLRVNDPDVHRTLSAYAQGISAFITDANAGTGGAKLPPEFADLDPAYRPEPWTIGDTLAWLKAELFVLAAHPESDLLWYAITASQPDGADVARDVYRPDPLEKIYITPGFPTGPHASRAGSLGHQRSRFDPAGRALLPLVSAFAHFSGRGRVGPTGASNNWALCGKLTKSGGTMLANDPHLGLDLPGNLYEFHFESDTARGAGFGIPGLPALVTGHNGSIAWGVTTTEADDADTYVELTEGDSVSFGGKSVAMEVRTEALRIRKAGGSVADFDEEQLKIRVVPHHGPVISDVIPDVALFLGRKALSVKWPGFGITHEPRAYHDLFRAHTYDDFKRALSHFEAGLLNFVYAGTDGDIGYQPHSIYPLRAQLDPKSPPYGVVPGTGAYEWTGEQIPDDRIMQLHNPASCRIFSANNDPAGVTDDGDALNDAYYLGGTFDYGLRAKRISDRLGKLSTGTTVLGDLESVQADVHSGLAEHFLPPLLEAAKGQAPSAPATELLGLLTAWDREDTVEQVAPTIFNAFYAQLLVDVFADDLPLTFSRAATDDRGFASLLERQLRGEKSPSGHDYLGGKSAQATLLGALEKVAISIPASLGADRAKWSWGAVHTNTFNHPLGGKYNLGPVALPGGLSSVNAARYAPQLDGNPVIGGDVFEGPNVRVVIELLPNAVTMHASLPTGESGLLGDPHYADQLADWAATRTHACHFQRDDVIAHAPVSATFLKGAH